MNLLLCTTRCTHAATGAGRFAQAVISLEQTHPEIKVAVISEDVEHDPQNRRFRIELPDGRVGYANKSRFYAQMVAQVVEAMPVDLILFNNAWLGGSWLRKARPAPAVIGSVRDDNAVHAFDNTLRAIPGMLERKRLEQAACRKLPFILTNTRYLADALTTHYQVDGSKISVIHPAYQDYSAMPQQTSPLPSDKPVRVLFAKHDYHRGGLHLVIEALAMSVDRQFELTIAGPEATVVKRKFGKQLGKLPHVSVNLTGPLYDQYQMAQLMSEHHIYCVPAKREAFGVAAIEALCAGLHVIYHPVGGTPDALRDFGFPVEEWNGQGVRRALVKALTTDAETFRTMKKQGRHWAIQYFSRDHMLQQLVAFLERVYRITSNPN